MNVKIKYAFILLCLLASGQVYAQKQGQERLDSLLAALPHVNEDSTKANLLIDISFVYKNIDPAKGIKYGKEGLALAEQLDMKKGMARAHNGIGNNHKAASEYPQALEQYLQALKLFEAINDQKNVATVLMNIGTVYRPMHEYGKALEYYRKTLETAGKQGNKKLSGLAMGNIGVIYAEQGNFKTAMEYDQKALKIFEEIDDKIDIAWTTENTGSDYAGLHEYSTAIMYYNKALAMNRTLNDRKDEASDLEVIGNAYRELAKTATGPLKNEYLQRSLDSIGKAKTILIELNDLDYLKGSYWDASNTLEQMGKYREALDNYKQFASLNDSIFSTDKRLAIAKLSTQKAEMDNEQQVKLNRILNIRRRNETIMFATGAFLLLLITGFVIKERKKSDKLLLNILPTKVASELKRKGSAAARNFNDVTVLFTDFVNFTMLAERMQPQELVDELHNCFKAFDAIVTKHHIEKIKTVGDAYLAVSGLPAANPQHAHNMVMAAIEIRNYMQQRKKQLGDNTFDLRIGINSGSVVAGIVGVKKFAYDIWGDTVNIAARMEQHSEANKVNISQSTYELVKDAFDCQYRGEIEAKNKGRLAMYFVECKTP